MSYNHGARAPQQAKHFPTPRARKWTNNLVWSEILKMSLLFAECQSWWCALTALQADVTGMRRRI